jgi:hypothetical protein
MAWQGRARLFTSSGVFYPEGGTMEQQSAALENELTPKMRAFLAAYGRTGRIGQAAEAAKVNRGTHHTWLRDSAAYRLAFEQTAELIGSMAEDAAVERAIHGIKKLVTYRGRAIKVNGQPLYETEYSDQLLLAILKKVIPAYRERTAMEHSGSFEVDLAQRLIEGRKRLLEWSKKDEEAKALGTA